MFSFDSPMPKYISQQDVDKVSAESFDSGFKVGLFVMKDNIILSIKKKYPVPKCEREYGCILERSTWDYVCYEHQEYRTSQKIIEMIKEYQNG